MTTTVSEHIPLNITPGVAPITDRTNADTNQAVAADKIRFVNGRPQKIGGWSAITMNGATISGCVRAIFSANLSEKLQTLFGSNEYLYALIGSDLTNITPLASGTTAIADSLDTHYDTLASDPLTTTNGSNEVVVADADAAFYEAGDTYTLSGATDTGGIGAAEFNKDHIIRSVGSGTITIKTSSNATSDATGGGGSVVRTSGLVTVNATAHDLDDGARVALAAATTFGGIATGEINIEHIIRNVTTNTFDVMTTGTATSSVSGGGGASTTYQEGIAAGICDETNGQGYGMGKYGVGLYGTALTSTNGRRFPRIWFMDTFGSNILATPGNAGSIYQWAGSVATAPTVVSNAPTDVYYAFVSNSILVTFGADSTPNRIKASDQGDITNWTSSSTNQVFTDDIEGAGALRSHVALNGTNLIFTNNQCYTFRYIGLPFVWEIKFKDNVGIIAPMARVVVKGTAYWMGENNFYMWRGGNIEVIPSNVGNETSLLNYVFKNINRSQLSKCFAWYNKRYDEIWFHYPSAGSNEVDRVARYHITDKHWTPDTFDRLAAEYPNMNAQFPRLIDSAGNFYRHEVGNDDDTSAMAFSLTTALRDFGTNNVLEPTLIPDSVQTGDITVQVDSYSYPQSPTAKNTKTLTIEPTTEFSPLGVDGRYIQYTFSGEVLGQNWIMGNWQESVQQSSKSE